MPASRQTLFCSQDFWKLEDGTELSPGKHSWEVVLAGFPEAQNDSVVKDS